MTRLAITRHRGLPEHTEGLIADALRTEIDRHRDGELVGVSATTALTACSLVPCSTLAER